jgi:hypothetical protein
MTTHPVFVTVPLQPRDRAALARAAHAGNQTIAQLMRRICEEWLEEGKLRTVPIPETTAAERQQTQKKKRALRVVKYDQSELT